MARLFVVNTTGQNRIVNYRTEFTSDEHGNRTTERNRPYKHISIPARQQVPFGGDMNMSQIHKVISTLERTCGAVPVKDIATAKARGVVKMIWNVDNPVPVAVLKDVILHNLTVLSEQGEDRRRSFAIGANLHMGNLSDPQTDTVRDTSVEFESVEATADKDLATPKLAEGFKIAKGGRGPRAPRRAKAA